MWLCSACVPGKLDAGETSDSSLETDDVDEADPDEHDGDGSDATHDDGGEDGDEDESAEDDGEQGDDDGDEDGSVGSCDSSAADVSASLWGPTILDATCTEGFFDGSWGNYGFSFDCAADELELSFEVDPDLPSGWWPSASSYDVHLRRVGEEVWFRATYPSGELFLVAIDALTVTPPDEPDFFDPLSLELVSVGCDWDDSECYGVEPAALQFRGTGAGPVTVFSNTHLRLGSPERLTAWVGDVTIGHDDTTPEFPDDCPPHEEPDRFHLLVMGDQP